MVISVTYILFTYLIFLTWIEETTHEWCTPCQIPKSISTTPRTVHEGEPEPTSHDDHEYVILPAELHDGPRAFIGTNEDGLLAWHSR